MVVAVGVAAIYRVVGDGDAVGVHAAPYRQVFQPAVGNEFHPHRFVDTGGIHVPAAEVLVLPPLLSAGFFHVVVVGDLLPSCTKGVTSKVRR